MEIGLLEQLDRLHEESRYQEIIDTLESLTQHDYHTIGHLARAYNNRGLDGDYDRAIQLLMMAEDLGKRRPSVVLQIGLCLLLRRQDRRGCGSF